MKKITVLVFSLVFLIGGMILSGCDEDEPVATVVTPPPQLMEFDPCCNSDGPGCTNCNPSGFNDGGDWDPNGTWIQEIAQDTYGTAESCWTDSGNWSGKPYYQMVMGISNKDAAIQVSCILEALSIIPGMADMYPRMAWCSETISYWHKEARIPYSTGYRNSTWIYDWQLISTDAMRNWYEAEELLHQYENIPLLDLEGRGRWIDWIDVDYHNFEPGINGPLPGAYVCLKCYDDMGFGGAFLSEGHSMLVDDMTVYRTMSGEVVDVKLTFLEGNTAVGVNSTRSMDDFLDYTPFGNEYFGGCDDGDGKKIIGFGIDLDEDGNPIYDSSRLHYVNVPAEYTAAANPGEIIDSGPDYATAIVDYAKLLGDDGIKVTSSNTAVAVVGIPDGERDTWHFSKTKLAPLSSPIEITIDLMAEHPVPIKGVELNWQGSFTPDGYDILWAGQDGQYKKAKMLSIEEFNLQNSPQYDGPIPASFGFKGQPVRFIKFIFPPNIFTQNTTLEDLRIIHDWGPDTDVSVTPIDQTSPDDKKPDLKPTVTPIKNSECPENCICVDKREADKLGLNLCNGNETTCGTVTGTNIPKYCYHKPQKEERSKCPDGCVCTTESEAEFKGLAFCKGEKEQCGADASSSLLYCYRLADDPENKPATDDKLRSVEVGE